MRDSNLGPPLSYAANLGRDRIIRMLYDLGAHDLEHAMDRAALQSRVETDGRNPEAKHAILALYVAHGLELPDTPTMALHRGRLDLLEAHLPRHPDLPRRTFSHEEIYPPEIGCHDEVLATHGSPLAGTTLLHMCVDYDEFEIAQWLIERGADVNTPAEIDRDGFGGHTALFGAVVSQPNFWMNYGHRPQQARFAQLLLDHGADPNARATIRKQMHPGYGDDNLYEYRDVTPLSYGAQFSHRLFVNERAVELILLNGGVP